MASYVIAAAIFILGSSFLMHFVVSPPDSITIGLEQIDLRSKAEDALGVLVGTPGVPSTWDADTATIETLRRLGLVETGATIRLDADKFDALARGRLLTSSSGNGGVDYAEAKSALGLSGYEFHLRAYPLIRPDDEDPYGLSDFDDYRIAYVGAWDGAADEFSAAALAEIDRLVDLNVDFRFDGTLPVPDDAFSDDSDTLRDELLPNIGALVQQTAIAQGSGTKFDFYRVPESSYDALTTGTATSRGLGLSSDGATLGYSKNRELRAIVGKADLRDFTSASLTWREYVDTDRGNASYDCQDYGYVEVSPDNGATWVALTNAVGQRSADCSSAVPLITPHGPTMTTKVVTDITATCPACDNNEDVLVAYHWVADNDNTIGYGWVVDDVTITSGLTTLMRKTFEEPEYDLLIVGSGVSNSAFTPSDIKNAMRDYVDKYGGRLMVTGPATNVQWLDRLFDAGIAGGSGAVSTPDSTHPLLTLPNPLDYQSYAPRAPSWDFTGSSDDDLFHAIVTESAEKHVLSVSKLGAWGSGTTNEGSVVLSSYLPHKMSEEEGRRFFANGIAYGKFHYLYLEAGPEIPSDEPVASAVRTATMNMHRTGTPSYTEMAFIIYVWPGASTAQTAAGAATPATPPVSPSATPGDQRVTLSWLRPLSNGSSNGVQYHIYRGHSPDSTVDTGIRVPYGVWTPTPTPYTYADTGRTNGVTYYYTVRLETTGGAVGAPSAIVSATPIGPPSAPTGLAGTSDQVGRVTLTWNAPGPGQTGGGTIFGYAIYVNQTAPNQASFVLLGEVGNVTTYVQTVDHNVQMTYKAKALNGYSWSDFSATATGQALLPIGPPTLTVSTGTGPSNLTLTWIAPDTLGQNLLGYRILRADSQSGTYSELAYLNSPANVSFTDVGLGPNATRWYKVQGVTNYGDGRLSDAKSAKTMATPDTPQWPSEDSITETPVTHVRTITWLAVSGSDSPVVRYDVYRGSSSKTATMVLIGSATAAPYVDSPGAGPFWYAVRAVSAAGASDFSTAQRST